MRLFFPLIALVGCSEPMQPRALYDLSTDELFDAPWPNDLRRDDDGTISLEGFPNPAGSGFLQSYLTLAEDQTGFGTNSPIYLAFDGPLDTSLLPEPTESLERGSAVALFAVAPGQPHNGERVPIQWAYNEDDTAYQPDHFLAVAPQWGFPLRPNTTYALVITDELAARSPRFTAMLEADHPDHAVIHDMIDALPFAGYGPEDLAVATTFTTMDPTAELARITRFLRERVEPPVLDQVVEKVPSSSFYDKYVGSMPGPLFQHGDRPYANSGGGFRFRESDGQPIVYTWEDLRIAVSTPRDLSEPPAGGWPVVIYQHGTGGEFDSFADGSGRQEIAAAFARAGYVGIGIDQPLHGTRATPSTDNNLHSFNYFNPESARANFRQGAIDAIWLAQALTNGPTTFTTDAGESITLNPDQVWFMGHSQGGLTGSIAAPFLSDRLGGMILSGAGAGLAITLVERKDPIDIAATVASILAFDDDEALTELHPVTGVIQMLVEVTDPLNYAPYWFDWQSEWSGLGTTNILLFSGTEDEQTPTRTAEALASAGGLTPIDPYQPYSTALELRGMTPEKGPLANNREAYGTPATAVFSQWVGEDHFVVFGNRDASAAYEHFLATGREGEAEVPAR